MLVLGIQKDHHSSVCAYENNKLVYYCEEERLSKEKKSNELPIHCINQFIKTYSNKIDMAIITGYDSDTSINTVASYLKFLKVINNSRDQVFSFYKSHHLIHAAKAFYDSGFEDAVVFVVDGRGSTYNLTNGSSGYETSSVYHVKNNNFFKCIYKKIYTNQKNINNLKVNINYESSIAHKIIPVSIDDETKIEITNTHDLGHFYSVMSEHFNFFKEEGKLMGLSAYGKEDKNLKKIINSKDFWYKDYGDRLNNRYLNINKYPELKLEDKNQNNLLNLSFLTQQKFEIDYAYLVKKYFNKKFSKNLILTGGTGLNVVNNFKISKLFKKNNLFVEPLCGDEGNSIGACQFYLKQLEPNIKFDKLQNLFIGNRYDHDIKINNKNIFSKKVELKEIVDLLIKGKVVALYQGRAEAGPRALGNRSLLLDPRIENGKDIMNKIKKRENFRPFACSVLKEKTHNWFNMERIQESPFMMYAVNVLNNKKNKIKSVVHVDNTCRVQTITKEYNKILYELLKNFYTKTKIPILMNTSFNLAGDSLVETPEDAVQVLEKSELEYIYFSDKNLLVYKNS